MRIKYSPCLLLCRTARSRVNSRFREVTQSRFTALASFSKTHGCVGIGELNNSSMSALAFHEKAGQCQVLCIGKSYYFSLSPG